MWPSRKSHFSISPSMLVFILLTPLLLISLIACNLGSQKSPFSWKSFGFLSSFDLSSIGSAAEDNGTSTNVSDSIVSRGSIQPKVQKSNESKEGVLKQELSRVKRRGFVSEKKYTRSEKIEAVLAKARFSIREAAKKSSLNSSSVEQDPDYVPQGSIYRNAKAFYRSYIEMEKVFKIYVYEEGEAPIFHNGPSRSIYSTEGRFIHQMEGANRYRTRDPEKAHVFFMPFSVVVMVHYLYIPGAVDMDPIGYTVADYVDTIAHKHPFWNSSRGADHFMLSCHDWGPRASAYVPLMFNTSIRVLCNANTSEGFNPIKDATLPEINLKTGEIAGLLGGPPPSERSTLAFFAGGLHGHIRHILLDYWKDKDPNIKVYEKLPSNISYESMLKNSKFCLCPSGYEVASPRVVEAIYAECVPVLISDSYVPPFNDVLNWEKFSVVLESKDIPKIKEILTGISEAKYLKLQKRVKQVQRHFVINGSPKRFDLFNMIVHSVWLRRLNLKLHDSI